jgi:hypothetical protein
MPQMKVASLQSLATRFAMHDIMMPAERFGG